jgi:hypothetical protein
MTQKDKTGSLYKKEKTSVNPRLPTFTLYMNFQTHIDCNRMKSCIFIIFQNKKESVENFKFIRIIRVVSLWLIYMAL